MTGNQLFNTVINGQMPNRLPIYIPTVACSVASEILGYPAHTGADSLHFKEELALFLGENAHQEFVDKHIEDVAALYRKLGADVVRDTWRSRGKPSKRLDETTLLFGDENGEHTIKRFFPETQSYGTVQDTRRHRDADAVIEYMAAYMDTPEAPWDETRAMESIVDSERIFTALADIDPGKILPGASISFPMFDPAWLEASLLESELLEAYLLKKAKNEAVRMELLADKGYRWFNGGGDMAGNNGPMISPDIFRRVMLRPLQIFSKACGGKNAVYCYRTDGNIWPMFTDMFITAGVQAYGEVDRDANMAVGRIRKENPNLLVLGNMSSSLLATGTEAAIRQDVKTQIVESGGSHFIAGPSNAIVHGTPVRNIYAMLEEYRLS